MTPAGVVSPYMSVGVDILGSGNTVGGTTANSRNVIYGDQEGVFIEGTSDNLVEGNWIGDATGTVPFPNGDGESGYGVEIDNGGTGNTIGGTTAGARDVISGYDIGVDLDGASGNVVEGDYIGTDTSGGNAVGNDVGVTIYGDSTDNTIGGTIAGAADVISGNGDGMDIAYSVSSGGAPSDNVVEGDYIGTNATGTAAVPNDGAGISVLYGALDNTIGGTSAGSGNVISGNTSSGVSLIDATDNVILGNDIGTDHTGEVALANDGGGVQITAADNNTIGGTSAAAGNVISGNGSDGVSLGGPDTTGNVVVGNDIGTDSTGGTDLLLVPNHGNGVGIGAGAVGNTIGGTAPGTLNVISGNFNDGVSLSDANTTANLVVGNDIGTDLTGGSDLLSVPNGFNGVEIRNGASGNTIGGTASGTLNVISGNGNEGVEIDGTGTSDNTVEGDDIGTDSSGKHALPNEFDGVGILLGASDNTIGGLSGGAGNLIADNLGNGVVVGFNATDGSTGNEILGNSITGNVGLGIDLGYDGVTPNHSFPSTGLIAGAPNGDQNFPVIASATFVPDVSDSNGTLIVSGSLAADQGETYVIQLFANSAADGSGFGEGQVLVASFDVTTDQTGNKVFSKSLATANLTGETISATGH